MAGKEFTEKDKVVTKMTRESVIKRLRERQKCYNVYSSINECRLVCDFNGKKVCYFDIKQMKTGIIWFSHYDD